MVGHFPIPHPDELLYSVCARAFAYSNPPSKKGFCEMLFGPGAIAVCDFPSRLKFLSAQLPNAHPSKPQHFLTRNTLLPLFFPFLPTERAERCRAAALSDGGKKLPFLTGVMASRLTQPTSLRFCPSCHTEDQKKFGEAYWHRSHQIEGVTTCHRHGTPLLETTVRRRSRLNRHEFHCPPAEWQGSESPGCPKDNRLAVDVHWLLNHNTLQPGFTVLRKGYIEALQEKRLAHPSGRIYLSHLLEQFSEFHGRDFLAKLNCPLDSDGNWLAQLVRSGRVRCAHPIQHLLLIHFMGHTAQSFFEILQAPSVSTTMPTSTPPRIKTVDTDRLKELWVDLTVSLREISRQLKLDPMTVKRKAVQAGLKFPRLATRPTRVKPAPCSKQAKAKLHYHRKQWEKGLRSGSPIRQLLPSTYSYLFRFDQEWLAAHRPHRPEPKAGKPRINWPERDRILAAKAEDFIQRNGCPPNPASICRELGITGLLQRNNRKLPQTVRKIFRHSDPTTAEETRPFRAGLLQPNRYSKK